MDIYREELLDHYERPRNKGRLIGQGVLQAMVTNASCGDKIEMWLRVKDGVIEDCKWSGEGCAISQASASKLSEYVTHKKLSEIAQLSESDILGITGFAVSAGRMKCLTIPFVAARKIWGKTD